MYVEIIIFIALRLLVYFSLHVYIINTYKCFLIGLIVSLLLFMLKMHVCFSLLHICWPCKVEDKTFRLPFICTNKANFEVCNRDL